MNHRIPLAALWAALSFWVAAAMAQNAPGDADVAAGLAAITPEALRAEIRFLADDLLEGRGTGTRGHLLAAHYMASRFEELGLSGAGDAGSFYQDVPLRSMHVNEAESRASLRRGTAEVQLTLRGDYILSGDPGRPEVAVSAPLAFVGYGVTAPEQGYDDYKGIDVKGKIVVVLFGAPHFPPAVKAHYTAGWLKRMNAAQHGAVGLVLLYDPVLESLYPFDKRVRDLIIPSFNWLDPAGRPNDYFPQLKVVATASMTAAALFFDGSGHSSAQVYAAAQSQTLKPFKLSQIASFRTVTTSTDLHSTNVVARLAGSDPTLAAETVVYSAHLDHLGISTPVNGDSIYNGALDNASGSAALLEVARAFTALRTKPRRSVVFAAVTGEEVGLMGSSYFATSPPAAVGRIIADINIDEDLMLWPLRDVIAYGAEHSTLDDVVQRATRRLGITASPDPEPDHVLFIRSDQYSFVRQGIPSLFLTAGLSSNDPAIRPAAILEQWEKDVYHQPGDDIDQPGLDFKAAQLYAQTAFLCGLMTANDPAAPVWKRGDFFGVAFPRH